MSIVAVWLQAVVLSIPPAAKVLAVIAVVYPVIQLLKKVPALTPYLTGWVAVGLNAVLTACGLLLTIPPDQLYTTNTLITLLTAILGAAGVHGTVASFSTPTMLGTTPPATQIKEVPAKLVPENPADKPVEPPAK